MSVVFPLPYVSSLQFPQSLQLQQSATAPFLHSFLADSLTSSNHIWRLCSCYGGRVFPTKHPAPWVWFLQLKDNAELLSFLVFPNLIPAAAPGSLLSGRREGTRTAGRTPGQCFIARMCHHEDQGVLQIKHNLAAFLSAPSLSFSIFLFKIIWCEFYQPSLVCTPDKLS